MIDIQEKVECCGCSACGQICPQKCIRMVEDEEGFLFPEVNKEKCIDCGACERVCPIIHGREVHPKEYENVYNEPHAIGGWIKDEAIRADSSSGGAFSLFANYVLDAGGVVYGATLGEDMVVRHIAVENKADLSRLRGSKYSQSIIGDTYSKIKNNLDNQRMVLFSGTPCQTAGLKSFLGNRKYDNLYVVDFICHGIPSPKVFSEYISYMKTKLGEEILYYRFRSKKKRWHPMGLSLGDGTVFETISGKELRKTPGLKDPYMTGFLDDIFLRKSCFDCRFKKIPKEYSDVTIADFWGVNKSYPELYDGRGTSFVMLNTKNGSELFDELKDGFYYKEVDYRSVAKKNPSLTSSVKMNTRRERFFKDFKKKSFAYLTIRYMNPILWGIHKVAAVGWNIIQNIIKLIMGRVLSLLHIDWSEEKWDSFFQFVKFAMIGVSNVAVAYTINVCTLLIQHILVPEFEFDYIVANVTAFLLSVYWSFHWNSRKVFKVDDSFESKLKALMKSYMSYAFTGLIVNNLLSTFWIHIVGISKFITPLLNIPISMPINFFILKLWAFGKGKQE